MATELDSLELGLMATASGEEPPEGELSAVFEGVLWAPPGTADIGNWNLIWGSIPGIGEVVEPPVVSPGTQVAYIVLVWPASTPMGTLLSVEATLQAPEGSVAQVEWINNDITLTPEGPMGAQQMYSVIMYFVVTYDVEGEYTITLELKGDGELSDSLDLGLIATVIPGTPPTEGADYSAFVLMMVMMMMVGMVGGVTGQGGAQA